MGDLLVEDIFGTERFGSIISAGADISPFPIDDVVRMAEINGFTMWEIENVWTDDELGAKMFEFALGNSVQVVNPAQGIRERDVSVAAQFWDATEKDLANILEGAQTFGKQLLPSLSLGFLAVIAVVGFLVFRKV